MPTIVPTLNFGGQCEEALRAYQKAFHAKLLCMTRYGEVNTKDYSWNLTEEQKQYIFHSEIMIGDQRIILNDNIDVPFQTSVACFLTIMFDTKEEVEAAYEVLKENSKTIYPIQKTSYSECRVIFIDRFGFRWGLMVE